MAQPTIQPSFAAGEIAPSLYARVDLAKYRVGLALSRNFFIDYRGGASNRPGTKYVGESTDASRPTRLLRFIFSTLQAYVLVFSNFRMKVVKDGAFVIDHNTGEDFVLVTPYRAEDLALLKFTQSADVMTLVHTNYVPMQLTRTAHDAWTLTVVDFTPRSTAPVGVTATPSLTGDGTGYRYVVTAIGANGLTESLPSTPATSANSKTMSATAGANQTIAWTAVPGAQLYNVYRTAEIAGSVAPDGQLFGFVGSATGSSFVDANINADFSRTPPQAFNPFTSTAAGTLSSLAVTAGSRYTALPVIAFSGGGGSGAAATAALQVIAANVAYSFGTGYQANDELTVVGGVYTRPARIRWIDLVTFQVIDGGSYTVLPGNLAGDGTAVLPGGITGGHGSGIGLQLNWGLAQPNITNTGSGYSQEPTVTVTGGGPYAVGGAMTARIVQQLVDCPGCVTYYQQREVFAASGNNPQTLWLSKTGDFLNFCYSSPSRADDSIIATLSSQQVNAIKHLIPMASLIALTSDGAWKIDGGSPGMPITPSSIQAIPQAYNGCSDVPPIIINYDILYVQAKGAIVRDLAYNFYVNIYTGADMTPLANHLFYGHRITEWAYAEEPFKLVWAVREDGVLLCFTFLKEQEVYAWSHHDTKGKYKSVAVIPEGNEDAVYVIVERYVQGAKHQYIERMASRNMGAQPEGVAADLASITQLPPYPTTAPSVPADLTRAWFVDCGLQYPLTYPDATLTPEAVTATPSIAGATVVAGGSGYVSPSVVVTDKTGSGAVLVPTIVAGVITAITVTAQGEGYTNPTLTVVDAAGTGAILTADMTRDVAMNASDMVFANQDVGAMVRMNNGWGTVRQVSGASRIIVNVLQPLTNIWPAESGEWSCTRPVSVISGLHHLEGETVAILADGNVLEQQRVFNGSITIDPPASAIVAGLPYTSQLQSLYIDTGEMPTVQGKRKKIPAVTVRVQDSRGMKMGPDFDHLDAPKERDFQAMGQPILPFTGDRRVVMNSGWDVQGQVCVQQDNPLPCTVLGLIPELIVGDTA